MIAQTRDDGDWIRFWKKTNGNNSFSELGGGTAFGGMSWCGFVLMKNKKKQMPLQALMVESFKDLFLV